MSDLVQYSSEDAVATITINRPERMNALSEEVIQGLRSAWIRYRDSDDRCAILTANGDRAFSVGADIKSPPKEMWQGVPGAETWAEGEFDVGVLLDKPIIAAVNGLCIGGAWILVQMCDLAVASRTANFRYPEAQVGFTGGLIAGCAVRVPQKIAMEFMLLGRDISAERAAEVGMINEACEPGQELARAREMADILRVSAPLVVSTIKRFVTETIPRGPSEHAALARDHLLGVSTSEDGAEGRRAFAEKRTPQFKGR